MKVVIIGNGIGGFSVASNLRGLSKELEITMISAETTPLYSPCVLPDYLSGKVSRKKTFVKTRKDYRELGIQTLFGCEAREIDPVAKKVFTDNRTPLPFDKLVLATGSEAVEFGERRKGIFELKTLQDTDEILKHKGKKAVVVGSGPSAIEIGIALHYRGYEVTILARFHQVLRMGLDQKAANKVMDILRDHGIRVRCGEQVETVMGKEKVEGLVTTKGRLECDTLIWAVGMRPRADLARKSGIVIGDKGGIKVNSHMETSIPGIYSCGDCVETKDILTGEPSLNLLWSNANRQGSFVAHNLLGISLDYTGSYKITNLDVFGNHIAAFGFTEASLQRLKGGRPQNNQFPDLSIIEKENNGSYYRLVIKGDRCMGGQFFNMGQGLGLLWSIMLRRRSIKEMLKMFDQEALICRRPWYQAIKPFFLQEATGSKTLVTV